MKNVEGTLYNLNFEKLCNKVCIGNLIGEPEQIFGGLLHKMYKIETEKGFFAVKALNPQIMQRETSMGNFVFSEKVANFAFESGIPALPAIAISGNSIHEIDGQYYLVFRWFDGKPLVQNTVEISKCEIIGGLLAKIHNLEFVSIISNIENNDVVTSIDWNNYIDKLKANNLEFANDFLKYMGTLYQLEEQANKAMKNISQNVVISHRDLDQKNVLWDENNAPMIIDWEAAGDTNPVSELLDVALYWSGGETGSPDKQAFCAVIDSYIKNGGDVKDNFEEVLQSSFKGKLGWLEYNIRRSLRIECNDDEEQILGTNEVTKTIKLIEDYVKLMPTLLEWLNDEVLEITIQEI